ncbi:MAG TPA: hypothetical protein VFQ53_39470 [Kofleriaceae bacterium]|nr:hypothetical protein [Kofleriaceae bacterium]
MRIALVVVLALVSPVAADSRCVIEAPPVLASPKLAPPACHRAPKPIAQQVTRAVEKRYTLTQQGARVGVAFPCDRLGARIREIVLETGEGHGGTLGLWRARRRSDGTYDVTGVSYDGASLAGPGSNPPYLVASGVVELPGLDKARAAVTATLREIVPPPKPGTYLGMSGSFSSRDFHVLVRLVGDAGRVVERRYTGYEGSDAQNDFIGLELAIEALAPITTVALAPGTPTTEQRALFVERFTEAVPHFDEQYEWWVMERYVELARYLGTPQTLRGLLTRLRVTDPKSRSQVDARADAVDAIATITGWDARAGGGSVEDAANAYLAQCR